MTDTVGVPRLRLGLLMWLAGMLEWLSLRFYMRELLRSVPLPAPLWVLSLASLAKVLFLVAVARCGRASRSPRSWTLARPRLKPPCALAVRPRLEPQLVPGLVQRMGGLLSAPS